MNKGQFTKNDPRRSKGGRPKEHPLKGRISMALWDAMVKLLKMKKQDAVKKMQGNPTILEITAWKYINDTPGEVINRFCGRIPNDIKLDGGEEPVKSMTITFDPGTD